MVRRQGNTADHHRINICRDSVAERHQGILRQIFQRISNGWDVSGSPEELKVAVRWEVLPTGRDATFLKAFDLFHAGATLAVTGVAAVLPGPQSHVYAMVNVWVPMAWMLLRMLWMAGVGRKSAMTGIKRE